MARNTRPEGKLADRIKETGQYELVEPLDQMILELLPNLGTLFAGVYPLGETVPNLRTKLPKTPDQKYLTSNTVSTRLRVLQQQGLVVRKQSVGQGGKYVWQRTNEGRKVFNAWKGGKGSVSEPSSNE